MKKNHLFYTITLGALLILGIGMFSINMAAKTPARDIPQSQRQSDGAGTWHNEDCFDEHRMSESHSHTRDCYDEHGRLKETRTRLDSDDSGRMPRNNRRNGHMSNGNHMRSGRGGCH